MRKNNDTIMTSHLTSQNGHASVLTLLMSIAMAILLLLALFYRIKKQAAAMAAKKKKTKQPKLPPGLATMPVVGNMHQMLMNKPVFRWIHCLLDEMGTEILCLRLGRVHVIAIASPEMAREVLRKNDAVLASRPSSFASRAFSFGYKNTIMSPAGDQWRKMRRVLASEILSPAMERRMLGRRVEEADHLVNYIYRNCNNGTVDVRHVTRHFCGNIIRKLVFGRRHFGSSDTGNIDPGHDEEAHIDALFTTLDYLSAFSVSDFFPARLHDPIIMERMDEWRALRRNGDERREVADFLDVLISLDDAQGKPLLSLDEVKAETLEIILATVDNPSNAVEWALAEMVNNPKVMKKAVDELDTVVGKERLVKESDIHNLTYLKACIREAFRIHPYHPFNPPHVAIADTTIAGFMIPKGSHVMLSRIGLGRNPRAWDSPLEFRPERHLKNTGTMVLAEPELRFVSFSAGRRGCPAVSLGTSITMMLFARLLQGFSWSIPPGANGIELQESATSLQLSKPLLMQAKPRLPLHTYEADILN
uniref:Tyrosine N-monooxygenase n=1 Tax=Oryza punctata TaxID=4537 RepID=A0A0E0KMR5_ORYPU